MSKRLTILGSTGSIGKQALEVTDMQGYGITALTAAKNAGLLEEQIRKWFEQLGIADKLKEKIGRMSFGQQQRVALIRSLVQPYEFLVVDEPISHLDDANAAIMGDIITTETKRQGAALIVTSIGKHINFQYDKILNL